MITGHIASKKLRLLIGMVGSLIILGGLLAFLLSGKLDRVEHLGLDLLQRRFTHPRQVDRDIVIVYIDQKSIDFFQKTRGIGWPWPRDAYGLVVDFMTKAQAKALVFDAVFSEPSVYNNEFNDDETFARAMTANGKVVQTLLFHEHVKGGAPVDETLLSDLAKRGLDYVHESGPSPQKYLDVTPPIPLLERAAWSLGSINISPDSDGVVRRMRPIFEFRGEFYPTLGLAAYMKLNGIEKLVQKEDGLEIGPIRLPLGPDGMGLIRYYGGLGVYKEYTIAAVIQSAVALQMNQPPMIDPNLFKDKLVFVGAKAAALYDLRSTPVAEALPGVEIQAAYLNNLLSNDFLSRASRPLRATVVAVLLLATLCATIIAPSVFSGAVASLLCTALYLGGAMWAFDRNLWLDIISPIAGQAAVFLMVMAVNYYGEGREKRAVRSAFSRYLSPHVVAQVIDHPELLSLGGSRRIMSAFFSDLAGFTTISEALSPEDLVALLNRYLSLMTRIIMKWGGTLDKFEGDAIMAFWGAPMIQEDHGWRACNAALEQQEAMREFRRQALDDGLPELKVRMGINTGPMIVGNMGSEERFDYTVMGDAVNLASRLEGANKPYGTYIMISEFTYAEVRAKVEVRELDLLRVKGKNEPIRVYELLALAGSVPPEKARVVERYLEGLRCYRDMKFEEAKQAFNEALRLDPEDGPSRTYVKRCEAYIASPPPPGWDGVFILTEK